MAHLRPSALLLGERSFDLAQSESHVFAEPDAWYSTQPLLGPHPGLWEVEALGEITRRQKVLCGVGWAVLLFRFRVGLGQPTRGEEQQQAGNLIERDTTSPLDERRIVLLN